MEKMSETENMYNAETVRILENFHKWLIEAPVDELVAYAKQW